MNLYLLLISFGLSLTVASLLPPTWGEQSYGLLPLLNGGDMFYWLFETSESQKPLILWLEGGPGISGMFQIFEGMGPYRFEGENLTLNQYSWNSVFFLFF